MPSSATRTPATRRRRTGTAVFAALIALSAWGGALGLLTGFLSLTPEIDARLPFGSPAFGGLALAFVVALPTTVLAWFAWHGDPRTDLAALVSGTLVIGWIVVELAFIRELSFFHPTYVLIGAALIWIGRAGVTDLRDLVRRRSASPR